MTLPSSRLFSKYQMLCWNGIRDTCEHCRRRSRPARRSGADCGTGPASSASSAAGCRSSSPSAWVPGPAASRRRQSQRDAHRVAVFDIVRVLVAVVGLRSSRRSTWRRSGSPRPRPSPTCRGGLDRSGRRANLVEDDRVRRTVLARQLGHPAAVVRAKGSAGHAARARRRCSGCRVRRRRATCHRQSS